MYRISRIIPELSATRLRQVDNAVYGEKSEQLTCLNFPCFLRGPAGNNWAVAEAGPYEKFEFSHGDRN